MGMKIFMTIALPFVLIWTVASRVGRELKGISLYVRCDVLEEIEFYKHIMKGGKIDDIR